MDTSQPANAVTSSQPTNNRTTIRLEFIATLLVAVFLAALAHPLIDLDYIYGLNHRYGLDVDMGTDSDAAKAGRAMWLAASVYYLLPLLAALGWTALRVARTKWHRLTVVLAMSALWITAWPFYASVDKAWPYIIAAAALLLLAAVVQNKAHKPNALTAPIHALAYPGWVLFTGIGLIWLLDFDARCHDGMD